MVHTLKLENQDGVVYYIDFYQVSSFVYQNGKIATKDVYYLGDKNMKFYLHDISIDNEQLGKLFANMLNGLLKSKKEYLFSNLITSMANSKLYQLE